MSHPAVVPRRAFTEGESANRLVVRSGVDCGPDADDANVPLDVVDPPFHWDDGGDDPVDPLARSRRRRGGLRVWLERPWYVSGEGEMLGVLLSGADGVFATGDARRQYVSLWGRDPIRVAGGFPPRSPARGTSGATGCSRWTGSRSASSATPTRA